MMNIKVPISPKISFPKSKSLAYSEKEFEQCLKRKTIYGESNIEKIAFFGAPPEFGRVNGNKDWFRV